LLPEANIITAMRKRRRKRRKRRKRKRFANDLSA